MRKPKVELTDEIKALEKQSDPAWITIIRDYKLITPLFGGGVVAGKVDSITPIRGTEVRGHLRFWWRATQAGRFGNNLEKLKKEEDRIWGAASAPSSTSLTILDATRGNPVKVRANVRGQMKEVDIGDPRSPFGYVAFPLRGDENNKPGQVMENITFRMRLTFPREIQDDMKAALWAWETFGGVGARTRRGFGALQCIGCDLTGFEQSAAHEWMWKYSCETAPNEIFADLQNFVPVGEFNDKLSHLSHRSNSIARTGVRDDATTSWLDLINAFKSFRQSRAGARRFGRSHWPEPDAIRDLTGQSLRQRGHDIPVYNPPIYKFPRASFGLPIIFEFKRTDSHPTDPNKDPRKTELKGLEHDRLASPLIIRPLACLNEQFIGLAMVLDGPRIPPGGLKLDNSPKNPAKGSETLTNNEAGAIASRVNSYNGNPDILQAFLDSL